MASKRKAQPMTDRPEKPSDEPVQDIRFWVKAFGEEIERSAEAIASRGRGGQQVGYSSADFAHCPPSTFGRLRRWLREFEGALESELTARTAETDEQAAERELGAWLVAHPGWTWSQIRLHGDYEDGVKALRKLRARLTAETEEQAAERELWREVKRLAADIAHPEGACALVRMINDRLNQPAHWRSLCAECDGRGEIDTGSPSETGGATCDVCGGSGLAKARGGEGG